MNEDKYGKEAQAYSDMIMRELADNCQMVKHTNNWKTRVIMQPFFGHMKGGDTIKIRMKPLA